MKSRPETSRRGLAARLQNEQEDRLLRILRGELEPRCPRERLFQRRCRRSGRIRTADFILTSVLYLAEWRDDDPAADDAPIFSGTASPRP